MDFSGAGGRIISDPAEAARVLRGGAGGRGGPGWSSSSDWGGQVEPECGEPWYRPQLGREAASLALFPHRNSTGVFLIRACSRSTGGFVLSFTTAGKIVHAQIVTVSHFTAGPR